jgi:3-phenylpropionate/trans-cinnamate dioxygenase ferredoxin subunit
VERYRVACVADITEGSLLGVEAGGVGICLARTDAGEVFALDDTCSHEDFPLSTGDLWGMEVECSLHGSRFDVVTGKPVQLPATRPVRTFPVTVVDGEIYVDI